MRATMLAGTILALAVMATPVSAQTMCTMDAMQCPDGSWVGRSGPNCEFVCPGQTGGGSSGNSGSKPTYPSPRPPSGTGPDTPVSDRDYIPPILNDQVNIIQPDMAEDMGEMMGQADDSGYLKNLLRSVASFFGGWFGWR